MSGGRNYNRGDRAALIAFSAGTCYWPGCHKPIVERAAGTFKVTLDIAHICALNETGERFDPEMSDDERNAFENLIVLCRLHHQMVDEGGVGAKYSVELLRRWKHERERGGIERLKGLQGLTESRLAELVNEAIKLRDADVKVILGRLEQRDSEAADLMNSLLEELNAVRSSSVLNVDAVEMLHETAKQLAHLPDSADALGSTARELASLEGTTSQLAAIVDTVQGLVGNWAISTRARTVSKTSLPDCSTCLPPPSASTEPHWRCLANQRGSSCPVLDLHTDMALNQKPSTERPHPAPARPGDSEAGLRHFRTSLEFGPCVYVFA